MINPFDPPSGAVEIDHVAPVVDLSKIPNDPNTPICQGCGGIAHGSVNQERNCFLQTIGGLRARVAALEKK